MLRQLDRSDFDDLAPLVAQLRHLQRRCKPFGYEWCALAVAVEGLGEAAEEVTGEAAFYRTHGDHR
jgi:hypothetical protein